MTRKLIGIAILLTAALFAQPGVASAQLQIHVLHSFPATTPSYPSSLIRGTDGNFYGISGPPTGDSADLTTGPSTIFKMTPDGVVTVLRIFSGGPSTEPRTLIQGSDGNLYGTTSLTFFRMTTTGAFTVLANTGAETLMQAADGNFYGTKVGDTDCGGSRSPYAPGSVYKFTPLGESSVLTSFCPGPNALMQAADGNFYGTTAIGFSCHFRGCTVLDPVAFKMTPSGTRTGLYQFRPPDGRDPTAARASTRSMCGRSRRAARSQCSSARPLMDPRGRTLAPSLATLGLRTQATA